MATKHSFVIIVIVIIVEVRWNIIHFSALVLFFVEMDTWNLINDYDKIISKKYDKLCPAKTVINFEKVAFWSASRRIISCFVNEELVASTLINKKTNYNDHPKDSFWVVVHNKRNVEFKIWIPLTLTITEKNINFDIERGTVRFLDPSDLGSIMFLTHTCNQVTQCEEVTEISQIFRMTVDAENKHMFSDVIQEIKNSIKHQVLAYKKGASFIPLWRPPIQYEQEIIVGHATHPMNKSRVPVPEIRLNVEVYNFKKIKVHFYKVPKASMNIYGNYEQLMHVVAKKLNICYNPETEIIVPVHELQQDVINNRFDASQLQRVASTSALSECSLRTVNIDDVCDYTFKLSLGLIITSAMRTITHWSVFSGPTLGEVIQKIVATNKYLTFLNELGSIIIKNDDFHQSKHFACIIRENVTVKLSDPLETAIVCAYLTEMVNDEYNITKLFHLKTETDKENFSDLYAKLLIDSFFDFVYRFGFTFEAHQQNVLLKVKKNVEDGYELVGFIVRDFGGLMVHQETLHSKIGKRVAVLDEEASIVADTLEDVYTLCYHTLFHCHLQQIFRSLGTHNNGRGWQFVRKHLNTKKEFLTSESCVNFFYADMAPYKSFFKMKMNNFERTYVYTKVPNLINFK